MGCGSSSKSQQQTIAATTQTPQPQSAFEAGLFNAVQDVLPLQLQQQGYSLVPPDMATLQSKRADLAQQLATVDAAWNRDDPKETALGQQFDELTRQLAALDAGISGFQAGNVNAIPKSLWTVSSTPTPTPEQKQTEDLNAKIQTQAQQNLLQATTGGGIPDATRALVNQVYDPLETQATSDLQKFGVELAGRQGLNLSDTPVAQPLLRQRADLLRQFAGLRAGSLLDTRKTDIATSQALRDFQNALNQQKIANSQQLFSNTASLGLGLMAPRYNTANTTGFSNTTQVASTNPGFFGALTSGVGAAGGLLSGLGGALGSAGSPTQARSGILGLFG